MNPTRSTKIGKNRHCRSAALAGVAWFALAGAMANAQPAEVSFNIEADDLGDALNEFAIQSGQEIIFVETETAGKTAPPIDGAYTPDEALVALLDGSGLDSRTNELGTILVGTVAAPKTPPAKKARRDVPFRLAQMNQDADRQAAAAGRPALSENDQEEDDESVAGGRDTIIVTGTSIRGVIPKSSPLDIYDRDDFERLGISNVEELLSAIPQNINSTTSLSANTVTRVPNARNINAPDLRGLGAGATLSLINGRRLPLANVGRAADVSLVPLGAVERVEVLTDGASSIYGADAVGGVVNFVLRDDYEGALTSANFAVRGEGGYVSSQLDQTLGASWDGGGVVASLSARSSSPFNAADVDFNDLDETTLAPLDQRYSAFVSAHQDITDRIELFADALVSDRNTKSMASDTPGTDYVTHGDTQQVVGTLGFQADILKDIRFELVGTYGSNKDTLQIAQSTNSGFSEFASKQVFDSLDITGKLDGTLLRFANRDFLFALGGGYLKQDMSLARMNLDRDTTYAFGELLIPVIGDGQALPLVQALEVNLSGRYTDTSDFGESFDPKVGVFWRLNDDFSLRTTWGEAFRAPELPQLVDAPQGYAILPVTSAAGEFPDPFSPDRSTVYFVAGEYMNPDLDPETSTAFTAGFDYQSSYFEGFSLSGTYFHIDYTDRIALAPQEQEIAADPEGYAELISPKVNDQEILDFLSDSLGVFDYRDMTYTPAPDAEAIAADVTYVIRNGLRNIASQETSGMDLSAEYRGAVGETDFDVGLNATFIFKNDQQATAGSPVVARADTITYPVDLRGRAYAGVTRNGWSGRLILNYVDSYKNTSVSPVEKIDSWTTLDLVASYSFSTEGGGVLEGTRLGFNVQNLFNEDPPFVRSFDDRFAVTLAGTNYDASNHDPFGRVFRVSLTKEW